MLRQHRRGRRRDPASSSRQFNIALDFEFEVDAADRNDRPGRQYGAAQFFLRIGVANRLLDLSLGSDTELLEERAYASAEGFIVHNCSSQRVLVGILRASRERNFNFATCAVGWECQVNGTAKLMRDEIADEPAAITRSDRGLDRRAPKLAPCDHEDRLDIDAGAIPAHRHAASRA